MKDTLIALRERNKLSRSEVANSLGVTQSAVSNYEYGLRTINIEQVLVLAELYRTTEKAIIEAQIESGQRSSERSKR